MTTEYTTVKLWEVRRTDKAILFQTDQAKPSREAPTVWIPLSQVKSIVKEPPVEGHLTECLVELPDWLVEAKGL